MVPTFKDVHPHDTGVSAGYRVTNEEPEVFRELLRKSKRGKFARGGGICSSGEVLLSCLLPFCDEVTVADHNYSSIAACWTKVLLLDKLGPKELKRCIVDCKYDGLMKVFEDIKAYVPKPLETLITKRDMKLQYVIQSYWNGYGPKTIPPSLEGVKLPEGVPEYDLPAMPYTELSSLRREWKYIPDSLLISSCKKLNKLTILHGDLTRDLAGKFDLFYISNALEHTGRDQFRFTFAHLKPLLSDQGIVLAAVSTGMKDVKGAKNVVPMISGFRTSYSYHLLEESRESKTTPVKS